MSQIRFMTRLVTGAVFAVCMSSAFAAPVVELNEPQSANLQQIVNVDPSDTLNMRAGAGMQYPVVAKIPHNGLTLTTTGRRKNGWAEVGWMGQTGWVNVHFLKPMMNSGASVDAVETQSLDGETAIPRPTKDMFRPKFASQNFWKGRSYWKQPL